MPGRGFPAKTPRSRIELELAGAILEGESLRRQRIGLALVAVIGGAAGAARLASGVDDHELAHIVVGGLVVIGLACLALLLARRAGRQLAACRRRAAVLDEMLVARAHSRSAEKPET